MHKMIGTAWIPHPLVEILQPLLEELNGHSGAVVMHVHTLRLDVAALGAQQVLAFPNHKLSPLGGARCIATHHNSYPVNGFLVPN